MMDDLKKSAFLKQVAILISGTGIAQLIPIIISPILTKLYSPESFGILLVYTSVISILSVLASLRYEKAIILPKEASEASKLVKLSQWYILIFCVLLIILNLTLGDYLLASTGLSNLSPYTWHIILGVLVLSSDQTYYHWANRESAYKSMSFSKIANNVSSGASSLVFGLLHLDTLGLLLSKFLGLVSSLLIVFKTFPKKFKEQLSLSEIQNLSKQYLHFPIYQLPSQLLNTLSLNAPPIIFAFYFSQIEVGFFALTQRVIMLPVSIVARSVGDVFRQKAIELYEKTGSYRSLYLKTIGGMFFLGLIPFLVLILFAPILFSWVFGADWNISGEYAQILSILFLLQFATSPITNAFIISQKQSLELFWQILFFLSSVLPIFLGFYYFKDMEKTLYIFAISRAFTYLLSILLTLPYTKK